MNQLFRETFCQYSPVLSEVFFFLLSLIAAGKLAFAAAGSLQDLFMFEEMGGNFLCF